MKYTKGPWKVEDGGFVGGPVGDGRICQFWNKFEEDFKNWEANARLIAAAPDLLEALKNVRSSLSPMILSDQELADIDALILKAEGRES